MAALKGYFDDTGKEEDPTHRVCGFAGCIGTVDQWGTLEDVWSKILVKFKIPYLHMKDFSHSKPPFDKLKSEDHPHLIKALCSAASQSGVKGIAVAVVNEDLARFREETGITLSGISFSMAMVIMKICFHRDEKDVECIFDPMDRPQKVADTAFCYLSNHPQLTECVDEVSMNPAKRGD